RVGSSPSGTTRGSFAHRRRSGGRWPTCSTTRAITRRGACRVTGSTRSRRRRTSTGGGGPRGGRGRPTMSKWSWLRGHGSSPRAGAFAGSFRPTRCPERAHDPTAARVRASLTRIVPLAKRTPSPWRYRLGWHAHQRLGAVGREAHQGAALAATDRGFF